MRGVWAILLYAWNILKYIVCKDCVFMTNIAWSVWVCVYPSD